MSNGERNDRIVSVDIEGMGDNASSSGLMPKARLLVEAAPEVRTVQIILSMGEPSSATPTSASVDPVAGMLVRWPRGDGNSALYWLPDGGDPEELTDFGHWGKLLNWLRGEPGPDTADDGVFVLRPLSDGGESVTWFPLSADQTPLHAVRDSTVADDGIGADFGSFLRCCNQELADRNITVRSWTDVFRLPDDVVQAINDCWDNLPD